MTQVLTFICRGKTFGIPVEAVEEILPLRAVSEIPSQNPYQRGGITVRGSILPLFDFRALVGDPRLLADREELVAILDQREQEHVEWLEALEASVRNSTSFGRAIDPAQCVFGKWYASYQAPDTSIQRVLKKFEAPHTEIHGLAVTALQLVQEGKKDVALAQIDLARTSVLASLLGLFSELKSTLIADQRELALVLRSLEGETYSIAVDAVDNIRRLEMEGLVAATADVRSVPVIARVWSSEKLTILEVDRVHLDGVGRQPGASGVSVDHLLAA